MAGSCQGLKLGGIPPQFLLLASELPKLSDVCG